MPWRVILPAPAVVAWFKHCVIDELWRAKAAISAKSIGTAITMTPWSNRSARNFGARPAIAWTLYVTAPSPIISEPALTRQNESLQLVRRCRRR